MLEWPRKTDWNNSQTAFITVPFEVLDGLLILFLSQKLLFTCEPELFQFRIEPFLLCRQAILVTDGLDALLMFGFKLFLSSKVGTVQFCRIKIVFLSHFLTRLVGCLKNLELRGIVFINCSNLEL